MYLFYLMYKFKMQRWVPLVAMFLTSSQLFCQVAKNKWNKPTNYDESKIPNYILPDPLICSDGTRVVDVKAWEQVRRTELLHLFREYMFGYAPKIPAELHWIEIEHSDSALDGIAIRKTIKIQLYDKENAPSIELRIYIPKNKSRVPTFLGVDLLPNYTLVDDFDFEKPDSILLGDGIKTKAISIGYKKNFWQIRKIISRGYGIATFCCQDALIDKDIRFTDPIHKYFYLDGQSYPKANEWAAISTWAWAMRIALSYLQIDSFVDPEKIIGIGHSRTAKTALWAAAQDKRFAMVISNNAGCSGTAISRRRFGETIEAINVRYPHWFCENYKKFNGRENELPFDQHELISLIAPRPIYIASAKDDNWSDQYGEFLGGWNANPVYELYGLKGLDTDTMPPVNTPCYSGQIGYHIRTGKHTMTEYDWIQYLDFADKFFKGQ